MRLGCHAVLFRERIKSETAHILQRLAGTGFKGVEIGSRFFGTENKQYLKVVMDKNGMELSGMHVGGQLKGWIENEDEMAEKVLAVAEFLKDMPNKNIVMSGSKVEDDIDLKWVARNIEKVAQKCMERGIKLHFHNHAWEFENDGKIIKVLAEYAPSLYFSLDLGLVYAGGFDPVEVLKQHAGRVSYVHLRDPNEDGKEFVEIGEGIFDYPVLMGVLQDILGDDGWAIVEYEGGAQDFERYAKAKVFLDSVM